jgi:voltage-gated potassium channel
MKESEKFKYLNNFRVKLDVVIFGTDTRMGRLFDVILLYVILVSIVLVMLESVQSYNLAYGDFFNICI